MTVRSETTGDAATSVVDDAPPPWRLQRQRSVPAAVVATFFAPCVCVGVHHAPRRVLRLGGNTAAAHHRRGEAEEEGEYFDSGGGVGLLLALWRRIVRGRRWKVMSGRGSSSTARRREQYGQDEYEQNFDEGAAAAAGGEPEPEYLSRSFSARYAAGGGRRSAGLARFGVSRAN